MRSAADVARYDRRYFDRWYRNPRSRVRTAAELSRRVTLAVAATEYLLGRPIRSVLDVGCGEAAWRRPLLALRPRLHYRGVDPSAYAVARYGRRRGILAGRLGDLPTHGLRGDYDLVVVNDVLHYLGPQEIRRGLAALLPRMACVAYLPVYAKEDDISGDLAGLERRHAGALRRLFREVGLVPLGLHLYCGREWLGALSALEQLRFPGLTGR